MHNHVVLALPFAGGSVNCYDAFARLLPSSIDFITLEYPGRGDRIGEGLVSNLGLLAQDLLQNAKRAVSGRKYVVFGHSMGCLVGYELIRQMTVEAAEGPIGAFFSGCVCPTINNDRHIANLQRPVFWQEIKAKGGMPKAFFDHPELMDFFEPILRHDLAAAETYAVDYLRPIDLPIHLMYGDDELGRADAGIESWRKLSTSHVSAEHFSGNHFFIFEHLETIVNRVVSSLTNIPNIIV